MSWFTRMMETEVLLSRMGNYLAHHGVAHDENPPGRGSGRYGWGTGENPGQHYSLPSLEKIEELAGSINPATGKKWTDAEIADKLGIIGRSGKPSSGTLRAYKAILRYERDAANISKAEKMRADGMSYQAIADKLGYTSESSIRNLLNEEIRARKDVAMTTANYIKEHVDKNGMYDVGRGTEAILGVSKEKLAVALEILELQGYERWGGGVPQPTNKGQQTNQDVICPPGTPHSAIWNFDQIHTFADTPGDTRLAEEGQTIRKKFEYPESIDSSRVAIRYREEGGLERDGLIEIRRGLEDCNIGENHYAQCRIMVDGSHYIKGMAVYSDDMPPGVDVLFNTNKPKGTAMMFGPDKEHTVLKPIKKDPDDPFGSLLKEEGGQTYYDDPNGKFTDPVTGKKQSLNVVNMTRFEGDWDEWKDTLPSQFLSKQPITLAKRQLDLASSFKDDEFRTIMELNNPTVKRILLRKFADGCDSAAVDLKAAALPRQKYKVLIPLTDISENEVYAPTYRDGEKVALVRYPHQGPFEIPILTVNNKNKDGIKTLGKDSEDAIGISARVAERLSGADFDGDTAMVIPTGGANGINIKSIPLTGAYAALEGFDPKVAYPGHKGMKVMKDTQKQMGVISNLITDMYQQGASAEDIVLATKHAQCVIDAEKHELDYKRSEKENEIDRLRRTYQIKENGKYGGAATLLSKAKGEHPVDKRRGSAIIDPETGKQSWKTAYDKDLYYDRIKNNAAYKKVLQSAEYLALKTQKERRAYEEELVEKGVLTKVTEKRTQKSTHMMETDDARTLISTANTPMENLYADYANHMKDLANQARKASLPENAGKLAYSKTAAKEYANEVNELTAALNEAKKQAVRERAAIRIANVEIKGKKNSLAADGLTNKEIEKELKKYRTKKQTEARALVGAKRTTININDRQWEAIQAGAIHDSKLVEILNHTDIDVIKQKASPRKDNALPEWQQAKIRNMINSDYTIEQVAAALGISPSTVSKYK